MWPTEQRIAKAQKFLASGCFKPQSRWVEFGAGFGTYILALHTFLENGWIVALELEQKRVNFLEELVKTQGLSDVFIIRGDFYDAPLQTNSMDGILLANVLHFSSDLRDVLMEACRVLRANGVMIIVEYVVSSPLPWVPYPLPKQKLVRFLNENAFQDIHLLAEDHRTYSITAVYH